MSEPYKPKGVRFFDMQTRREMLLVTEGHCAGWICYRHPDGGWVTLREATEDDKARLEGAR